MSGQMDRHRQREEPPVPSEQAPLPPDAPRTKPRRARHQHHRRAPHQHSATAIRPGSHPARAAADPHRPVQQGMQPPPPPALVVAPRRAAGGARSAANRAAWPGWVPVGTTAPRRGPSPLPPHRRRRRQVRPPPQTRRPRWPPLRRQRPRSEPRAPHAAPPHPPATVLERRPAPPLTGLPSTPPPPAPAKCPPHRTQRPPTAGRPLPKPSRRGGWRRSPRRRRQTARQSSCHARPPQTHCAAPPAPRTTRP